MAIVKKYTGESDASLIFRFRKTVREERIIDEIKAKMFFQTKAEKKKLKLRRRIEELKGNK